MSTLKSILIIITRIISRVITQIVTKKRYAKSIYLDYCCSSRYVITSFGKDMYCNFPIPKLKKK